MKNIEEQIVNHQKEAALDMEETASSQLQNIHLWDADGPIKTAISSFGRNRVGKRE